MPLVIRDADPDSAADAVGCASVYAPYVTATVISFEETPPTAAEMADRIRAVQLGHPWLLADLDGEVRGYAYAHAFAERAAYRWSCEVSIYLASHARGQGLGRLLYTELLDRLTTLGFRSALAGISQPNEASNCLHLTLGFEQCALYRGIGHKAGAWQDVAWFQRPLGEGASTPPS
jgi:L-amino acid N-acyltransferase YncA